MNFKILGIATLLSSLLLANDSFKDSIIKGKATGSIQVHHVFYDLKNGYAPSTGSSLGGTIKYESGNYNGFKAGVAFHSVGDSGLSDKDDTDKKMAGGLFISSDFKRKDVLGEAYIEYKNLNRELKVGRQEFKSPMTSNVFTTIPTFYEALIYKEKSLQDTVITVAQIDKISFGSRSLADFGPIGEFTGSAGASVSPMNIRGEFQQIEEATVGAGADTNGLTILALNYNGIKNLKLQVWDYFAHDIVNTLYAQADYKSNILNNLTISGQYLQQNDIGDSLIGDKDASLFGLKLATNIDRVKVYVAYSKSSGDKFLNPWTGDPAFTSSLFTRNGYRADVDAFKAGIIIPIFKELKFITSYANYGQSSTKGGTKDASLEPTRDAQEIDSIFVYNPNWLKNSTFKLLNVQKKSEYQSLASIKDDKKMNNVRLIIIYKF